MHVNTFPLRFPRISFLILIRKHFLSEIRVPARLWFPVPSQALSSAGFDWQWVVLDGPVDPFWVENLNSMLDDTQTLCLANSERIALTKKIRVIFEVDSLSQASPATVSRCGVVYMVSFQTGSPPRRECIVSDNLLSLPPAFSTVCSVVTSGVVPVVKSLVFPRSS